MSRIAVVGAGIVGLAHAWSAAERGHAVTVYEEDDRARGASVRNFGMVWPIGTRPGALLACALEGRARWLEAIAALELWHRPCGATFLAQREDEWAVLEEFAARGPALGFQVALRTPRELGGVCPGLRTDALVGGLHSATEVGIDPHQALERLPRWLAERAGVRFRFGTQVESVEAGALTVAGGGRGSFDRILVCAGSSITRLFPELFEGFGVVPCKLQMMRTRPQPNGFELGALLASGLTLRHYPCFAASPAAAVLARRVAEESPLLDRYGIHVMAAQHAGGQIVLGDSHEYGAEAASEDKAEIDALVLDEVRRFLDLPDWTIEKRWHGHYPKHPDRDLLAVEVADEVHVLTPTSGTGMTLAFGMAERFWSGAGWAELLSAADRSSRAEASS